MHFSVEILLNAIDVNRIGDCSHSESTRKRVDVSSNMKSSENLRNEKQKTLHSTLHNVEKGFHIVNYRPDSS